MNDKRGLALCLVAWLLAGTTCLAADATNSPPSASASLEFLDGSLLLGSLQSIDPQNGVRWKHVGAKSPLEFVATNLHQIRFNAVRTFATNAVATCRLRFSNGDDVSGELVALDENSVEINTWFAGTLRAPRNALASIAVTGAGNSVIYEGPENVAGWKFSGSPAMGGRVFAGGFGGQVIIDNGVIIQGGGVVRSSSTNVWQVRNNALIASGAGTAGRDFKLPPLSRIEFDLAWRQTPSMRIGICTDTVDRMDMSSGYQFYLSSSYMYLYRRSGGDGGAVFSASENVRIPQMTLRSKVHFEFRLNKEKETVSMLADGQPLKTWRVTGAQPEGSGLLFYSQRSDAALRIGNRAGSTSRFNAPRTSFFPPARMRRPPAPDPRTCVSRPRAATRCCCRLTSGIPPKPPAPARTSARSRLSRRR
ncbi:MAG: hypothetical protein HY300_13015 [Verrucomicrobia bacterium]|nr:hypothetical protein [Verrucomicrobiota bacterium]